MARYLSAAWIDELSLAVEDHDELAVAAEGVDLVVQQRIIGAPGGDVEYHVTIGDGVVKVNAGAAVSVDVTFTQDYATAAGVASGAVSALQALNDGRVAIRGDVNRLRTAQAVLGALEEVLDEVRQRTTY
jgi:alkyl sulfatase BDS1-like metallo-beta-lactamase superfamily hydrolase